MATPSPDQVLFRCHACRQKFAVKPSRIGARFKCTKCQVVLQVPAENALDRPEASKPQVRVQTAQVKSGADSISELSFDDLPALSASASMAVDAPSGQPEPEVKKTSAPKPEEAAPEEKTEAKTGADSKAESVDGRPKPSSVIPKGKKACPNCAHVCPGMALSCPLCQHRFEVAAPKPKPVETGASASPADSAAGGEAVASKPEAKAASKAGSPALKPKKDLGKALDDAVTIRGKGVSRPVEPPMWMDELVYGTAFKMGFAGLSCMAASLVIFIQLDSPESARNAFFLIRWLYPFGGRWVPSLLCLAAGVALLYFAIKPVVIHLKRERELQKPVDPFDE